jgi:hypothetical protein
MNRNEWVADSINNRVLKLNSSGSELLGIGTGYQGGAAPSATPARATASSTTP